MSPCRFSWLVGLLLLGGCYHPDSSVADQTVLNLANRVRDPEPDRGPATPPATPPADGESGSPTPIQPAAALAAGPPALAAPPASSGPSVATTLICQVPPSLPRRPPLSIPPDLPGANAPPIRWPATREERARETHRLYPTLLPLPEGPRALPGPGGRPLTLADLQRLALANHPSVKSNAAAVEAAKGAVRQAGAYPNPTFSWEADTVGTGGAGYQGAYIDQPIKGANKLKLQKAAATMDLRNAEVALRRAETDVMYGVRTNYFAVLVALENVRVSRALAVFTERVYRIQVDIVEKGDVAAPYEPMQLRPLVLQARFNLLQALNQYQASWKQLAASLGLPGMPPAQLAGRVDMPVPVFSYEDVLARALSRHTDVLTAENSLQRARYSLELAQATPFPDFDVRVLLQKDYTTPPHLLVYSCNLSFPVAIWDRNQGGIMQAYNQMLQAGEGPHQARVNLTTTLADAYNRYETAREQVRISLAQVEDQVRAFRSLYERWGTLPGQVAFNDVVTAEQTLATYVAGYVTALGLQWTAVVDVANVLQTDDLFQMAPTQDMVPVPDLEHLVPMPCAHPAGGLPEQCLPERLDPTPPAGQPVPGPGPVVPQEQQAIDRPVLLLPVALAPGRGPGTPSSSPPR
jgi:cobalt-zinc-cadmium efflux system outer membrane protein